MNRSVAFIVAAVMLLADASGLQAQTALTPAWVHQWNFGQDPLPGLYAPPSKDNHVMVDPVTGLVHCTISDEPGAFSIWNELLYTFDPQGTDLTPVQPPVVGNVPEAYYPGILFNGHATFESDVYDGSFIAAHAFTQVQTGNWATYASFGTIGGLHGMASMELPAPGPTAFQVTLGDGGYVLSSSTGLVGLNPEGWPIWRDPAGPGVQDVHMQDGTAWALLADGQVERIDMATGVVLPGITATVTGQRLLVGQDQFFGVEDLYNGNAEVTGFDGQGNVVYNTNVAFGSNGTVTDAVLDNMGRVWITFTETDLNGAPITGFLAGIGADGTAHGPWTYGASMNSIACDAGQLYITGRVNITDTDTYLIGVDMGIAMTTADEEVSKTTFDVWPNPTRDEMHFLSNANIQKIELLDASGRVVRSWSDKQRLAAGALDLSCTAPGHYVVRALSLRGVSTASILIQ